MVRMSGSGVDYYAFQRARRNWNCYVVQKIFVAEGSTARKRYAVTAMFQCAVLVTLYSASSATCPWLWPTTTCGGYISAAIIRYKVRWIEMAAVLPYWTCMLVYYVEADKGHLMNEVLKNQQYRTAVRGHVFAFMMPWEQVVRSLHQRVKSIPRDPECLKYMLRLHLKVAGCDFHEHLRQVHLRPAVLVILLRELFSRRHEAFLQSEAAQEMHLDSRMQALEAAVYELYPETEASIPLEDRKGSIPSGIREMIEESQSKGREAPSCVRTDGGAEGSGHRMHQTKNATPGDAPMPVETCLDDIRPKAFTLDAQPGDCTSPDAIRQGALARYADFHVEAGNKLVPQWESKFFSKILPFVFPRMCSGPDFKPDAKWRREELSAVVTPMEFTRALARRIEGQIRNDAVALPIVRSAVYKWTIEHMPDIIVPYQGDRGTCPCPCPCPCPCTCPWSCPCPCPCP